MKQNEHNDNLAMVLDSDTTTLRLPTRLEWVARTAEFLRQRATSCGVCNGRSDNLVMALHEALTNAIVHGNLGISSALKEFPGGAFAKALAERSADPALADREVTVNFDYDGQRCQISIADEGAGFDWKGWTEAQDASEPNSADETPSLALSGRGILMMRAFMDEVRYERGGREVIMTLRAPTGRERRVAARRALSQTVRVAPVNGSGEANWGLAWDALSRDISKDGLALIHSEGHTATRVLVEMKSADGQATYLPAEVCRVTPLDGGLVHLGCRFDGPEQGHTLPQRASDGVVCQLIGRIEQQAGAHHRRAHQRVAYTAKIEVCPAGSTVFHSAYSRDLSRGGIAFVAPFAIPAGAVALRLPLQGSVPSAVSARVVRCQKVTAGVYDIGCVFT